MPKLPSKHAQELEKQVILYRTLKMEMERLEAEIRPIKEILQTEAKKHEGSLRVGIFKVQAIDCAREVFDLKLAKVELGQKIAPYISESRYTMLRVS